MSMSEQINYKKEKRRKRLLQKRRERTADGRKNAKNKKLSQPVFIYDHGCDD